MSEFLFSVIIIVITAITFFLLCYSLKNRALLILAAVGIIAILLIGYVFQPMPTQAVNAENTQNLEEVQHDKTD